MIANAVLGLVMTGAMPAGPSVAKLEGMNGRVVVFQCSFDGAGFNLGPGGKREDQVFNPDLIVSLNEELTQGQAALLTKKSDFETLTDRRKVFAKAKAFAATGRWPGDLRITGTDKQGRSAVLSLSVSRFGGSTATAQLTLMSGASHRGSCNILHLKPAGFSL